MTDYLPKVGDRVRATLVYEGVVRRLPTEPGQLHAQIEVDESDSVDPSRYLDVTRWSFEKLPDPEPVWVNGDVVQVRTTGGLFVRSGDTWRHASTNQWVPGGQFNRYWAVGGLEILHKQDA